MPGLSQHIIDVLWRFKKAGKMPTAEINKAVESLNSLERELLSTSSLFEDFTDATGESIPILWGLKDVFSASLPLWRDMNLESKEMFTRTGWLANRFRYVTHGARGFRMELLSVMFGAQMVSGAMMGLLKPAADTMNLFDIFGTTLKVFFLPTISPIAEVLYDIMSWFMDMPEPVKKVVGAIVLFIGLAAGILALAAAIILFAGGLVMAAGVAGVAVSSLVIISAVIAAIILIVIFLYLAWKNNWFGIRDIVKRIVDNIRAFIKNLIWTITHIPEALIKVKDRLLSLVGRFFDIGKNIVKNIVNGIKTLASTVVSAIWNLIPEPFRSWIKGVGAFVGGIAGGIAKFLGFGGHRGFIGSRVPYVTREGGLYEPTGGGGKIFNLYPTFNIRSTLSSEEVDTLSRELAERFAFNFSSMVV